MSDAKGCFNCDDGSCQECRQGNVAVQQMLDVAMTIERHAAAENRDLSVLERGQIRTLRDVATEYRRYQHFGRRARESFDRLHDLKRQLEKLDMGSQF